MQKKVSFKVPLKKSSNNNNLGKKKNEYAINVEQVEKNHILYVNRLMPVLLKVVENDLNNFNNNNFSTKFEVLGLQFLKLGNEVLGSLKSFDKNIKE